MLHATVPARFMATMPPCAPMLQSDPIALRLVESRPPDSPACARSRTCQTGAL
jgi:hypothetical protein